VCRSTARRHLSAACVQPFCLRSRALLEASITCSLRKCLRADFLGDFGCGG
jgi:hypothetical protein